MHMVLNSHYFSVFPLEKKEQLYERGWKALTWWEWFIQMQHSTSVMELQAKFWEDTIPAPAAQFSRTWCLPYSRIRATQISDKELRIHTHIPGEAVHMGPLRFIIFQLFLPPPPVPKAENPLLCVPKPVPCCESEPNVGVFWFASVPNEAVLLLVPPNLQFKEKISICKHHLIYTGSLSPHLQWQQYTQTMMHQKRDHLIWIMITVRSQNGFTLLGKAIVHTNICSAPMLNVHQVERQICSCLHKVCF